MHLEDVLAIASIVAECPRSLDEEWLEIFELVNKLADYMSIQGADRDKFIDACYKE